VAIRASILTYGSYSSLNRCFLLYESITDSWKPRDAELIGQFLTHGDYKKVAEELGKDTSLMWRRHNSLRMREYGELKNLMRDMVFALCLANLAAVCCERRL
jgi:hypothetical protein